ncbi:WD40 repeat-like protein [Leucogyrophana mollusca]|uniref:WD40 repeat-like protein n=1 Tax=Leucogyrophana mollusca TaxID=85980 RepID=A0ACB8BAQ5_9AGAM|nr:WD40 repeat-like protein [Leucogyrophana mollusca]
MDNVSPVAVHRCRFVDFTPSPITALAFPPLPLPSLKGKKPSQERERQRAEKFGTLGVGRANGNIELCEWTGEEGQVQASQAWQVRKTLSGPCPSKVDSLAFTLRYPDTLASDSIPSCSDLRLFSSGGGSELIEWDILRGCVRRTIGSQAGAIWSIAANPASTLLALGCEDGSVRLLSLVADTLSHHRRFDRIKSRLLSIAWGPPVPRQPKAQNGDHSRKGGAGGDSDEDSDEDEEDDWSDSWLVTGGSDSSLRKWDVVTGRVVDRMGTDKVRGERTLVWTVGVLADGTIISGDSLGTVKFWDSTTCTQLQSFSAHGADVLCLTVGPEGTTIYTSGVDQKIVQFTYVPPAPLTSTSPLGTASGSWIQSNARRLHSHDVRSLAIWPPYSPLPHAHKRKPNPGSTFVAPILASGGLDMSVVLTPALPASMTTSNVAPNVVNPLGPSGVCTFEDSYHKRIAYTSTMCVARKARLVASMHETGINVWRVLDIPSADVIMDGMDASNNPETRIGWENVLDMELSVRTNLVACALSDDGKWLVASDLYETKLFELVTTVRSSHLLSTPLDDNYHYIIQPEGNTKPRRVRALASVLQAQLPSESSKTPVSTGGSAFAFTPDSSKLVVATAMSAYIVVIDLTAEEPTVLRRFDHHRKPGPTAGGRIVRGVHKNVSPEEDSDTEEDLVVSGAVTTVTKMAVSPDGQWLASSDGLCRTFIFNLDSIQYHTTLPSLPLPASILVFLPESPQILLTALPNNSLHVFDVEQSEVPAWAQNLTSTLPVQLRTTSDPVIGVAFEPRDAKQPPKNPKSVKEMIFWGSTWLCKLKLGEGHSGQRSKRRRKSEAKKADAQLAPGVSLQSSSPEGRNVRMITHFRPILALDFLGPAELVVVERPLVDVLSKLPPAFFKPKYGST